MLPGKLFHAEVDRYQPFGQEIAPPYYSEGPAAADNSGQKYWSLVRAHWLLLSLAVAVCAATAYWASLRMTPSYRAATVIEIRDPSMEVVDAAHVAAPQMMGDAYFQTQIEMLTSRSLLGLVVDRLKLDQKQAEAKPAPKQGWLDWLNRTPEVSVPPREQAIAKIRDGLEVVPPRGSSRLVTIRFDAQDPELAAEVSNTLAEAFIDQDLDLRKKSNRHTAQWLTQEVNGLRGQLQASEDALQAYSRSVGMMMLNTDQETVAQSHLKQLQDELSKAEGDRIAKQAAYSLIQQGSPATAAALLDTGPLREYAVKLADAQQKLAQLQALYTPNHYRLKEASAEVEAVQHAIDLERANVLSRSVDEYQASKRREQLLSAAFEAQTQVVSVQDVRAARYVLLKREVESNRTVYDTVLQKVKSVQVDAALVPDNIVVVDAALPPSRPYKPRPTVNAIAGALAGLMMSGAYVFIVARTARKFRTPEDAVQYLNVPELGAIPSSLADALPRSLTLFPNKDRGHAGAAELVTLTKAPSAAADSFRAAVASILFTAVYGKGARTLTITSAAPREGKTTVVANLAVVLAQMKHRILLVDGDVRKPRLHTIFGLDNERGLTDILSAPGVPTAATWQPHVKTSTVPGLSIITSGGCSDSYTDIFDRSRIQSLMDSWRKEYDVVMIDAPPVLNLLDARMFGRHSDGVIVVCKVSDTEPAAARVATRRLQMDGSNVLGTILTDVASSNFYFSYYNKASKAAAAGEIPA